MKKSNENDIADAPLLQIKASAGSGKTHALTEQYIRHLCDASPSRPGSAKAARPAPGRVRPASFGDIVAITFTNAAVAELRERVLSTLKKVALGLEKREDLSQEQALSCLEILLDDMGQMNVRTIDSLLYQVVRGASAGLGLSPEFQPVFSLPEVVEESLAEYELAAETGSEEHQQLLKEVMQCFLASRKKESDEKKFFFNKPLLKRLEPFLSEVFLRASGKIPSSAAIRKEHEENRAKIKKHARNILDLIETANASLPAKKQLQLSKYATDALTGLVAGDFSKTKAPCLGKQSVRELFNKKDSIVCNLEDLEKEYAPLKDTIWQWKVLQHYLTNAPMLELAGKLAIAFWEHLPEQKLIPSDILPLLAKSALNVQNGVCDALCRMGSRLSHFLIDEFQDTSLAQWEGLKPLIVEAISRGGSFTWVGDVKQSIFMWRNASPGLFDGLCEDEEISAIVPEPARKSLLFNRRSAREIVEHNNRMFSGLENEAYAADILRDWLPDSFNGIEAAAKRVAQAFKGTKQDMPDNIDPGGHVNMVELEKGENGFMDNFGEELLQFLKARIGKGLASSDVLVLVRSGDDASALAEKLAAHNISVISDNSLLLASQPLVEQGRAFLEFLDNPANDVAFMTILEGDLFAGHPLAQNLPSMIDFAAEERDGPLYAHFRKRFPDVWEKIFLPFYKQSGMFVPYDAVREWYARMGAASRFPGEQVFVTSFLEQIYAAEINGIRSIPAFLDFWKENGNKLMATMPEGVDAVKVMTIHKAKGLAAPVVFAPLSRRALEVTGRDVSGFVTMPHGQSDLAMGKNKDITPDAYLEDYVNRAVEALDLLYVAFTRPRKELHIYTEKKKKGDNLVRILADKAKIKWPCGTCPPPVESSTESGPEPLPPEQELPLLESSDSVMPWRSWLKIAPSKLFSDTDATRRGTFLHFCLENARFTGDVDADAENAFRFGVAHASFPVDEEKLASLLPGMKWLLGFEEIRHWLQTGWPEQPLMNAQGKPLRADLLVRLPHCMLVVDYKTGPGDKEFQEDHVEQIRSYIACVKQSAPDGLPVLGLIAYLDKHEFLLVEENACGSRRPDLPLNREGAKK